MELTIDHVTMQFKNKLALNDVSCTLTSGQLVGLIGPNGAGKSTLMKILATLQHPTSGSVRLDGVDIRKHPRAMKQVLGYMPQQVPIIPQLSAVEYLRYIAAIKGLPRVQANDQIKSLLVRTHLADAASRRLGDFSGGMQQRVGLAAALLGDPQVIIVDEPSAGLDPIERIMMRNLLSELAESRIVLLSTHIVSDIEAVASRLLLLKAGQLLFQGSAPQLIKAAIGHVWEYVLPQGEHPQASQAVSEMRQAADGIHIRLVAPSAPTKTAVTVTPTLEDATLSALEGR
ncbi:ATP-binding cassette domain-containing protein [Schleiferilactobacillus harbinensis]|uniref:ATP-binding cassette domain-containing protein n=1 Tax=Schleiferilactobacillus harbinensis TaxID=304207 RepID=UPI0011730152|nr:ATP-binding cassette domain-containing protein [Schleiferilactobacillus harbinensis]GEK07083.1 ABC transporter ATP-binding protein [Schleiferilactobacillus harbinensis]